VIQEKDSAKLTESVTKLNEFLEQKQRKKPTPFRQRTLPTSATLLFQSDTPGQRDFLVFHFWFRVPLSEVLRMHPAVKPDVRGILTN
jgi:hypothetical protein